MALHLPQSSLRQRIRALSPTLLRPHARVQMRRVLTRLAQTQCASQAARPRPFVVHSRQELSDWRCSKQPSKSGSNTRTASIAVGERSSQRASAVGAGSCSCMLPTAGLWSSSSRQTGWQKSRGSYQSGGKWSRMSRTRRKAKTLAS